MKRKELFQLLLMGSSDSNNNTETSDDDNGNNGLIIKEFMVYLFIGMLLPSMFQQLSSYIINSPNNSKHHHQHTIYPSNMNIAQLQRELETCATALEKQKSSSSLAATSSNIHHPAFASYHHQEQQQPSSAAICAIQKGGLFYIDEWVDYHLALGFETIYIYDNSDDFELQMWAQMRRNPTQLQVIHWPGIKQQKPVYQHCATKLKYATQHKWVAMFDIDEYVSLNPSFGYKNIVDLLEDLVPDDKAGLVVNRVNFYFSDVDPYSNDSEKSSSSIENHVYRPVTQRFQYHVQWEDWYKTIGAKIQWILWTNVHGHTYTRGRYVVDANGNDVTTIPLKQPQGINTTAAILYHYQTYSLKEFQFKCQRGDAAFGFYNSTTSTSTSSVANTTSTNSTSPKKIIGNHESCLPSDQIRRRFRSRRRHGGVGPEVWDDHAWKFLTNHVPKYRMYQVDGYIYG